MTDLLTPEGAREVHSSTFGPFREVNREHVRRLCRDYLMLWDRMKELEKTIEGLDDEISWRGGI